jgi:BMFP domain-containing protein YqiC
MADDPNEILGHVIAETIKERLAPLLKRIEQLELRVSMADDFKRLESRLQQLEARDPAKPTLRVVNE